MSLSPYEPKYKVGDMVYMEHTFNGNFKIGMFEILQVRRFFEKYSYLVRVFKAPHLTFYSNNNEYDPLCEWFDNDTRLLTPTERLLYG
jgi:hypothetical protein